MLHRADLSRLYWPHCQNLQRMPHLPNKSKSPIKSTKKSTFSSNFNFFNFLRQPIRIKRLGHIQIHLHLIGLVNGIEILNR